MQGPGSGKSTTAAYLFYYLKSKNCNVELVREYAKEVVYEGSYQKLENQVHILGEQYKRLNDIARNEKENVNLVITDCPIMLGSYYARNHSYFETYMPFLLDLVKQFDNIDVLITRVKKYNPYGRLQTAEQSDDITRYFSDGLDFDYRINGDDAGQKELGEALYERFKDQISI